MKKRPFVYVIFSLIIALGACNDPVFYMISVEPPLVEPLIGGSPTNFTVFNKEVYVASGRRIFSYDGKNWKSLSSQPGGRIMRLAATDSYLYALCFTDSGGNTILRRFSAAGKWEDLTGVTDGYNRLQSVYAANDKVFIGAERNGLFIILYMADDDTGYSPLTPGGTDEEPVGMLCGIAYDDSIYYLCTGPSFRRTNPEIPVSSTVYVAQQITDPETTTARKIEDVTFTGIINLGNNNILAISRSGDLYNVNADADITVVKDISLEGRPSTGALAVWVDKDDDSRRLLLAGRQDRLDYAVDSGYTYGYMELELDPGGINGIKAGKDFNVPGTFPSSSVADYERYVSTIRKYPVNHIFQTPKSIDPEMTLFASTQKNGVWSYRQRGSEKIWNAEE